MKTKIEKPVLIITNILGTLFFILFSAKKFLPHIVINIMFWSRWDEIAILLLFFVSSVILYLIVTFRRALHRGITLIIGLIIVFSLIIINVLSYTGMRTLENNDHTLYLVTTGFNTSGTSTVYLRENWLYSRQISSTPIEDNQYEIAYSLEEDIFHIVITDIIQDSSESIDIDLSLFDT